jgi:hypothetical protein
MQNPALGGKETFRVPSARSLMSIAVLCFVVPGFASVSYAGTQVGARVAIGVSASANDGGSNAKNAPTQPRHAYQPSGPQLKEYRPNVSLSLGTEFKTLESSQSLIAGPRPDFAAPGLATAEGDSVTLPEPNFAQNPPTYIDLNPYLRSFCETLGVEIGSTTWLAYGCELYPGQTGGQNDFGWRQDHAVPAVGSQEFARVANAILSNAGYRPTFYLDKPQAMRMGYGRPWTWVPDPTIDDVLSEGWYAPNGKLVTGHDMQHFSLKFLAALSSVAVDNEQKFFAKAFMWRYMGIVGGWLRTDFCKAHYYSSREVGRVLDFVSDCVQFAPVDDPDLQSVIDWIEFTVLPQIPTNGMGYIYKPTDQGYKPEPNLGVVEYSYPWQDGLMVPGMWRFGGLLIETSDPHLQSLGQELRDKARSIAIHMASIITADGACPKAEGIDGKLSWVENEKYGYSVWCYRALRIAGADGKADLVFQKYGNLPYWWPWFVEPDGSWNPNLPMANN